MHEATREHGVRHRLHQAGFNALYRRTLIYNQCWEDPKLDRVALELNADSEVLVITSAGCNALDYLLLEPRRVHAVDANPRQTALLELKIAGIKALDWQTYFQVFGKGLYPEMKKLYRGTLRQHLSPESQAFWDKNWKWWKKGKVRRSFFDHGLAGVFARMFTMYVAARPALKESLQRLTECTDMDEQRRVWDEEVAGMIFSKPVRWTLERQATMNLVGVPYEQQRTTAESHGEGIAGYVYDSLGNVVHNTFARENYFYRVYLEGGYTPECCPEYLKQQNFERLKGLTDRISVSTTLITDYLRSGAARPSHLVLLDHMDWMGTAFPDSLVEEWEAILDVSEPGARILFRSGEKDPAFLDKVQVRGRSLRDTLDWNHELASELHPMDRVGTYASFWIGNLKTNDAPSA